MDWLGWLAGWVTGVPHCQMHGNGTEELMEGLPCSVSVGCCFVDSHDVRTSSSNFCRLPNSRGRIRMLAMLQRRGSVAKEKVVRSQWVAVSRLLFYASHDSHNYFRRISRLATLWRGDPVPKRTVDRSHLLSVSSIFVGLQVSAKVSK